MKNRFLKMIICISLAFCTLLPKQILMDLKADTPTEANEIYLYTYNGSTYNNDKKHFMLTLGQTYYTDVATLHDCVTFEVSPYTFYQGDYIKVDFMLDILNSAGNRQGVVEAVMTVYNNIDKTSSQPYYMTITHSEKDFMRYTYQGSIEELDKPGNCLRFQIYLVGNHSSTTGVTFHSFNVKFDDNGKTHGLLSSIISFISNLPNGIANSLSSFFSMISSAIYSIGTSITDGLTSVLTGLSDALTVVKDAITGTLNSVSNAITSALVDLYNSIYNGLLSLFVPSDAFLGDFFTSFNDLFSTQFGFLWYPVEFVTNFLNEFKNKSSKSAILSWNTINDPVFNLPLIPSGQINFTEARKKLDDTVAIAGTGLTWNSIFYYFTDGVLYLGLIMLASKKVKEMLEK